MKKLFWLLFSFQGRITRLQYFLSLTFVNIFLGIILVANFPGGEKAIENLLVKIANEPSFKNITSASLLITIIAAFFYFHATLDAKRLHDLGRSGWWQIIFFITFVLSAYSSDFIYSFQVKEKEGQIEYYKKVQKIIKDGQDELRENPEASEQEIAKVSKKTKERIKNLKNKQPNTTILVILGVLNFIFVLLYLILKVYMFLFSGKNKNNKYDYV